MPPSLRSSRWSTLVSLAKRKRQGFDFQGCRLQKGEENSAGFLLEILGMMAFVSRESSISELWLEGARKIKLFIHLFRNHRSLTAWHSHNFLELWCTAKSCARPKRKHRVVTPYQPKYWNRLIDTGWKKTKTTIPTACSTSHQARVRLLWEACSLMCYIYMHTYMHTLIQRTNPGTSTPNNEASRVLCTSTPTLYLARSYRFGVHKINKPHELPDG